MSDLTPQDSLWSPDSNNIGIRHAIHSVVIRQQGAPLFVSPIQIPGKGMEFRNAESIINYLNASHQQNLGARVIQSSDTILPSDGEIVARARIGNVDDAFITLLSRTLLSPQIVTAVDSLNPHQDLTQEFVNAVFSHEQIRLLRLSGNLRDTQIDTPSINGIASQRLYIETDFARRIAVAVLVPNQGEVMNMQGSHKLAGILACVERYLIRRNANYFIDNFKIPPYNKSNRVAANQVKGGKTFYTATINFGYSNSFPN